MRYYEQQGLVTGRRTPSGHREYDAEDVRGCGPGAERCAAAEVVARRRLAELDGHIARLSRLRERLAARLGESGGRPGSGAGDGSLRG
ncbi:MerR family DNA-binding protein [Streptomyces sp. 769]|uniref:MerR family DNA-binding protein n=1 Tax=Streptomyces sp. 769 TaxID=1262452 RepID=UPI000581BC26|nr:MerR family DNA-binding protein [Streptomyces sp. 769]AJC56274.1 Cu(I)-responsive transcriptional regulator [Streptomyces sp. 769]